MAREQTMPLIQGFGTEGPSATSEKYGGLSGGTAFRPQQETPHRSYQCDQCSAVFTQSKDLKRHKRVHWVSDKFRCDGCDKTFSRPDNLKRHQRLKHCGGKNETKSIDSSGSGDTSTAKVIGPRSNAVRNFGVDNASLIGQTDHTESQRNPSEDDFKLPCEIYECAAVFDVNKEREWMDHLENHLGGVFPSKLRCWFNCHFALFDSKNPAMGGNTRNNFESRMRHIRDHIVHDGYRLHDRIVDGFLVEHLRRQGMIDERTDREWLKPSRVPPKVTSPMRWERNHHRHAVYAEAVVVPELKTARYVDDVGLCSRSDIESHGATDHYASQSQHSSKPYDQGSTNPTSIMEASSAHSKAHQHGPKSVKMAHDEPEWTAPRKTSQADDDDEIQSIASSVNSISSTESMNGSLGQAGVNYIVAKLTGDPELLALYTEAGQKLTELRFVNNNRRLVSRMYLDMSEEAHTASQKEAAAFLRSSRRRQAISSSVFMAIVPDDCSGEVERSLFEENKKKFSMLDRYLRSLDAAETTIAADELEDLDLDRGDDDALSDMGSLQATGEYLVTTHAFAQYKQRFRQFLHPGLSDESRKQEKMVSDPLRDRVQDPHTPLASHERGPGAEDGNVLHMTEYPEVVLEASEEREQTPDPRQGQPSQTEEVCPGTEKNSTMTRLQERIVNVIWPPANGSRRMWYRCGCGEHTYLDVKELRPGGAETLQRKIMNSAVAARRRASSSGGASSSTTTAPLSSPPQAYLRPSSPQSTSSIRSSVGASTLSSLPATISVTSLSLSNPDDTMPKFLLVCINGKAYKTLPELRYVDVTEALNDDQLLKGILEQYEQARKGDHWTISLLIPAWISCSSCVSYIPKLWGMLPCAIRSPSFLEDFPWTALVPHWLSELASEIGLGAPLHILDTADFVRFHLIPRGAGKDPYPSQFKPGQWPTVDDVLKYREYLYKPVPMVDAEILTMNLWHMRKDGPHTECFWYDVVPKKLNEGLFRPPGTRGHVYGYGIRIHEKLNILLVLWWMLIAVVITGLAVALFALFTKDNSLAFGLGAYLVAVLTVYIPLQYEVWKRS